MSAKKKEYETGYGKPPKNHQWKKGQSGNPSGGRKKKKPKAPDPLPNEIANYLAQKVSINQNGTVKNVSVGNALIMAALHEAIKAPLSLKIKLFEQLFKLGVFEIQAANKDEDDYDGPNYNEEDLRILEIVQRRLAEAEDSSDNETSGGSVIIGRDDVENDGDEEDPGDGDEPSSPAPDDLYGEDDEGLVR